MTSRVQSLILVIFLLLCCAVIAPAPLELSALFLLGWVQFLIRVAPHIQVNPSAALGAIVCVAGVLILGQVLGRYLMREISPPGEVTQGWRFRWTLLATGAIVVSFAAGTAAVGVAHQSVWLIRSEEPLYRDIRMEMLRCRSNLHDIGLALHEYARDHDGHLPDELSGLSGKYLDAEALQCPTSSAAYVYHGRGLKLPLSHTVILVCEPLSYHGGTLMSVLRGDRETELLKPVDAEIAMRASAAAVQAK